MPNGVPAELQKLREEAVINWIANPQDNRTVIKVAEDLGVARRTIYRIKAREGFMDRVYERATNLLGERLPDVINAIADKAIEERDLEAAKFCLEITGKMAGDIFKGAGAKGSGQQVNINFSNIPRPDNGETIDVGGDS